MKIIDLSMPLDARTPAYPGDPGFASEKCLDLEKDGVNLLKLTIGTHTGTHVDVPLHHIASGEDAASFPLEKFIGAAVVIPVKKGPRELITPGDLACADIRPGDIVLANTGWDASLYQGNYCQDYPAFAPETAEFLIQKQAKSIGADVPSVDRPGTGSRFHRRVLSAGLGVIEALFNLQQVNGRRVFFAALPLKIASGDGSPVRAVAIVDYPGFPEEK